MAIKKKITLSDIKNQIIWPALSTMPYRFKLFVSTGAYQNPKNYRNLRVGQINGLIEATDSDISLLGGGIRAVAMNISMHFLIPVDDTTADGDFSFVEAFRESLSEAFPTADKTTLTLNAGTANEKNFIGAVSVGFPIGGELLQRPGIGKSFEYTCYIQIAFLENAINSSDVQFYLDGDTTPIPYTTFSISRRNTLTANLYSNTTNGVSKVFAENSTFGVDLAMPAISASASVTGTAINEYIMRVSGANKAHSLRMVRKGAETAETTETVIFGEVIENGAGTENVSWQVSFVPYIEAEDD